MTAEGNIETNVNQSTTGNVYGIYDLAGGAFERVASYYNGSNLLDNATSFASNGGKSTAYVTAYEGDNVEEDNIIGDATYETSNWNNDSKDFVNSDYPLFVRGGHSTNGSSAGIFSYRTSNGERFESNSFRMCIIVE